MEHKLPRQEELKSILFNNFSNKELSLIISAITKCYPDKQDRKKLVFAKTTEQSLKMNVAEWIEDTGEDHLYLLENPPSDIQKKEQIEISKNNNISVEDVK